MHRFAYRNLGTQAAPVNSFVANFTVNVSGVNPTTAGTYQAGIRWFEMRRTGDVFTVFDQGTHNLTPGNGATGLNNWMGSIAQDHVGNIGLGFSQSSTAQRADIKTAGRTNNVINSGVLNEGEALFFAALGSQTGTLGRWGDYSAMNVDPVDDCTFWYTQEYYATTSGFGWSTRVGSFRFPSCTAAQKGTINGTITNCNTGLPINLASVDSTGGFNRVTGAPGTYSMTVSPGTYTVTASSGGFSPASQSGVPVANAGTATVNLCLVPIVVPPDLTITKTHTGSFAQGSTGNTYTVSVTNSGAGDKTAGETVTVTDAPPSGLTITAMSGTGWTCTAPTCTRSDLLAASTSYPAITVTVSVAANATSPQVNAISVTTTQAESNTGNNGATDSTVITPVVGGQPDLTITKTHSGNLALGSTGNTYTVIVTNSGTGDKSAGQAVTVADSPSSGLTVTAMSGAGWTCTTLPTCTRSDVLAAGVSYPLITVTVSVAANATTPQANSVSVSTAQAESNSGNNGATDITIIAGAVQAIPTLSEWAIIGMGLLLVAVAVRHVRRRAPTRV